MSSERALHKRLLLSFLYAEVSLIFSDVFFESQAISRQIDPNDRTKTTVHKGKVCQNSSKAELFSSPLVNSSDLTQKPNDIFRFIDLKGCVHWHDARTLLPTGRDQNRNVQLQSMDRNDRPAERLGKFWRVFSYLSSLGQVFRRQIEFQLTLPLPLSFSIQGLACKPINLGRVPSLSNRLSSPSPTLLSCTCFQFIFAPPVQSVVRPFVVQKLHSWRRKKEWCEFYCQLYDPRSSRCAILQKRRRSRSGSCGVAAMSGFTQVVYFVLPFHKSTHTSAKGTKISVLSRVYFWSVKNVAPQFCLPCIFAQPPVSSSHTPCSRNLHHCVNAGFVISLFSIECGKNSQILCRLTARKEDGSNISCFIWRTLLMGLGRRCCVNLPFLSEQSKGVENWPTSRSICKGEGAKGAVFANS